MGRLASNGPDLRSVDDMMGNWFGDGGGDRADASEVGDAEFDVVFGGTEARGSGGGECGADDDGGK